MRTMDWIKDLKLGSAVVVRVPGRPDRVSYIQKIRNGYLIVDGVEYNTQTAASVRARGHTTGPSILSPP